MMLWLLLLLLPLAVELLALVVLLLVVLLAAPWAGGCSGWLGVSCSLPATVTPALASPPTAAAGAEDNA